MFNSRSLLNQQEKGAVEQLKEERWRKAQLERDALEAKEFWEKNIKILEKMNTQRSYEYIQNQNLREGVRKQAQMKRFSMPQGWQDKKEAEKWWKENIKYFQMMNNKDGYEFIQKQNLREGVLKKVEDMFVLQWQRPLQ